MPGSRAGSVPVQDKDQQQECAEQITSEIKWCGLSHPPHFWDSSSPAEQAAARGRLCSLDPAVAACCRLESHADEAGPFLSGSSFSLVRPRPVACPDGLNDLPSKSSMPRTTRLQSSHRGTCHRQSRCTDSPPRWGGS